MSANRDRRNSRLAVGLRVFVAGALVTLASGAIAARLPGNGSAKAAPSAALSMSPAEYEDRVRAAWYGQIAGTLMGFAFEHRAAATAPVDRIPDSYTNIPVDDDWYYEMVAVRAFERFGIGMSAAQLGRSRV